MILAIFDNVDGNDNKRLILDDFTSISEYIWTQKANKQQIKQYKLIHRSRELLVNRLIVVQNMWKVLKGKYLVIK